MTWQEILNEDLVFNFSKIIFHLLQQCVFQFPHMLEQNTVDELDMVEQGKIRADSTNVIFGMDSWC